MPFNRPHAVGTEYEYVRQAVANGHTSGEGPFTRLCHRWLESHLHTRRALLTHSCTAALEMTGILANLRPGDEVIMPSFTFVSTANAFVLRGAVPVFVDIRPDTLNIDASLIESAITPRTRAIVVVHYAGVACEMDSILELARRHGLLLIEDAAQALGSTYRGRSLGTLGQFGTLSFHETKNVISGEGGALLVNDERFAERAEIIREKGTNRQQFFRGEVDKYTWIDVGSSFLPSDIVAAFLWAQLEVADVLTTDRIQSWQRYHERLEDIECEELARRPVVPNACAHNGHLYYLLLRGIDERTRMIHDLAAAGVHAIFHYVPLHSSPAGRRLGRTANSLPVTESTADRLVRLPLWIGMTEVDVDRVCDTVRASLRSMPKSGRVDV
ncbi:MAG: dTDP-4-amino-4,6-dideoxygalactose transaminase [Longimicrobiales bacterium]